MTTAFRSLPGFRSLRLGDVLDVRPALSAKSGSTVVAAAAAAALSQRFGLPIDELAHRLEVVIVVADSLLSRAFTYETKGDPKLIEEATTISKAYLTGFYGDSDQT